MSNDNPNINDIIDVPLTAGLTNEKAVEHIKIYKIYDSLEIPVNHRDEKDTIYVSKLSKKSIENICNEVDKRAKDLGLDDKKRLLIKNNISNQWKLFAGLNDINGSQQHNKQQNESVSDDLYDIYDRTQDSENENNDNNIPTLGALQASRAPEGRIKTIGKVVSKTVNFRVILSSNWHCINPAGCKNHGEIIYPIPIQNMPKHLDNTAGTNPSCWVCKTFGSLDVEHKKENARRIQLDDIDTTEEKFDRLNVVIYGKPSEGIPYGEIVEIEGNLITQKTSSNNNTIMLNVLHSFKPIIYKNKKENKVTQQDIDNFYRWKKVCIEAYKKESELVKKCPRCAQTIIPLTFEQRIDQLFAPNVIGHNDAKRGILRSLVRGNKNRDNGTDNGRRGRIHTDLVGDPGTAKTLLSTESNKLDLNSRHVDAAGASGKSLVGIVDKEGDTVIVKYGVIVSAKDSHVVINEASELSYDDQGHLVGIAEEGRTTLDKWGEHIPIEAPTTLIFTTNPLGTKWESTTISKDKMVVIRKNLLDRIDQTYGFFDSETEAEEEAFIKELRKISKRKPHNYSFLSKYLQYVKTIEPKFTGNAEYRLEKFYIDAKMKKVATKRSLFSIMRIAEAQAKLNLSWEVDDYIATKTMTSLELMYNQYGKLVKQIQDPKDMLLEEFYDILKHSEGTSYDVYELCRIGSENNKHIKEFLNRKWSLDTNRPLQKIIAKLEEIPGIKIIKSKPRILQFIPVSDPYDLYDRDREGDFEKNSKNFENNGDPTLSYRSYRSDSIDKLVKVSSKGPPIPMTNEQHDSFFGNKEEEGR
jgi:DNA replicative helicase MCM subunit Mcm2 (Cdc46/Mcm family)